MSIRPKSVLFVSLGGKCRTPMATGVFQKMVKHNDLEEEWIVDYAALNPIHVDELVDQRVIKILEKHAIRTKDTMRLTVRLATEKDLKDSDFVLCMDELDMRLVKHIGACWVAKVKLFGDYHPTGKCNFEDLFYEVDDPDDEDNDKKFENMYQMSLECVKSFLRRQLKPQEADYEMDDAAMPVLERYDSA